MVALDCVVEVYRTFHARHVFLLESDDAVTGRTCTAFRTPPRRCDLIIVLILNAVKMVAALAKFGGAFGSVESGVGAEWMVADEAGATGGCVMWTRLGGLFVVG